MRLVVASTLTELDGPVPAVTDAAFSWFVCFLLTSFLLTSFLHALHLGGNQTGDAEIVAAVPGVQRLPRAGEFASSLYPYVDTTAILTLFIFIRDNLNRQHHITRHS